MFDFNFQKDNSGNGIDEGRDDGGGGIDILGTLASLSGVTKLTKKS